jgi:hypothetical protein
MSKKLLVNDSAGNAARIAGFKNLDEFSFFCGIAVRTLQNWYNDNRVAFDCMLMGAVQARLQSYL